MLIWYALSFSLWKLNKFNLFTSFSHIGLTKCTYQNLELIHVMWTWPRIAPRSRMSGCEYPLVSADFSYADDDDSDQSWMVRSLSESSVACITGDFAMQNVLLQMGLRLLAPGGTQIHQLHR